MRVRRAFGLGAALAVLGTGSAQAADELSVTQRLEDRREVAAGTRAQVLGFQDGRFYANGWHTTGEMGGIVTPPLKLLDSVSFGVDGEWIEPATKFTSGRGYARYDLPETKGIELRRTDVVPDGRRGALLGLELKNPGGKQRTVTVMVDAHSELMTQYPWGFSGTVPNASENAPDTGAYQGGTLVFRDTGQLPGEKGNHSYTAIVGSDRRASGGETGPGHYGPNGAGTVCAADQDPAPMPVECDDGPFGRGTGGQLRYSVKLGGHDRETLWIAVAGSENSPGEARSELARLTNRPGRLAAEKLASRRALARHSRIDLPGDPTLEESIEWGKQNLADLTQTATDVDLRWTNEGKEWTPEGSLRKMTWIGAGFPDYPWLFAVDGEYTAHAAVTLGQFEAIEAHMRAVRDISDQLSDRSGVVVHEVVADGSIWHGKDNRIVNPDGSVTYDFNTDEIVKFPGAVALIWRWSGDDRFRDEMLDFTWRNLEYVRTRLDDDGDGWPEGIGNVERPGMGEEKLDNAVYYIRGLYDYADMARSAGQTAEADAARGARRRPARRASRTPGGWRPTSAYADSLDEPGDVQDQPEALDRRRPDGGRAVRRRRVSCPAWPRSSTAPRRSRRARPAATAASGPATAACSTRAAAAGRPAPASSPSSRSTAASWRSARATTAASAPTSRRATRAPTRRRSSRSRSRTTRPTSSRARCRRSSRRSRRPARSGRRRTSTAAGRAARCSCRPGATTAPLGRSCTSSSACGRTSATGGSR